MKEVILLIDRKGTVQGVFTSPRAISQSPGAYYMKFGSPYQYTESEVRWAYQTRGCIEFHGRTVTLVTMSVNK